MCTTILAGKLATYDGSTMMARNNDGHHNVKKMISVRPEDQPRTYTSKIAHLTIELPDDPLRYTCTPSVDQKRGIWAVQGINAMNVGMTATETLANNALVLGADPMVEYREGGGPDGTDIPGGIGEEDMVVITLPYIRTAREGVLRLGSLLEKYGTYEQNGIGFSDPDEVWWLETVGGHHWIARRVADEEVVIMPNQCGLDKFDFEDAFGAGKNNLCSADLKEFIAENHLDLMPGDFFCPRVAFGTHDDGDHCYNTPRAWYMARYFLPRTFVWDGPEADFTPESDDIPWSFVPEKLVTVEDVKYILSSYYQGTPYNPYSSKAHPEKGIYRPIGISRTSTMSILQIRGYLPAEYRSVQWVCFGSNAFNAALPVYTNSDEMPAYLSNVTMDCDTNTFYWASRLIESLVDPHFGALIQHVERWQEAMFSNAHRILNKYDKLFKTEGFTPERVKEANEELAKTGRLETVKALNAVLLGNSEHMLNGFSCADN